MTPQGYGRHKDQLLKDKADCDAESATLKIEVAAAKRNFNATGQRADVKWLCESEARLVVLKGRSQELQRQIATLNANARGTEIGLDHFVHEVLLEQMSREEVTTIFKDAIIRRRLYLDSHKGERTEEK